MGTADMSDQSVRGFLECGWEGCGHVDMLVVWIGRTGRCHHGHRCRL